MNPLEFRAVRSLVAAVLDRPDAFEWSYQGFGFIRTYLGADRVWRLHLWDTGCRSREDVTTIHDHPWHLRSLIVSGLMVNQRYLVQHPYRAGTIEYLGAAPFKATHHEHVIRPGENAHLLRKQANVALTPMGAEYRHPGQSYSQFASEVHESLPTPGTVTIVEREVAGPDEARVYYPIGTSWVDAAPRPATPDEVEWFVSTAKARGTWK